MSIKLTHSPSKETAIKIAGSVIAVRVLILCVITMAFVLIAMVFSYRSLWARYHEDDRITYVMLDPVGNWTVERTNKQKDDFYMNTVDASISRLISKCLSNRPATIVNDWSVCGAILSPQKLNEFFDNRFVSGGDFEEYVAEHSVCHNCDFVTFKVKDIDHKNSIPTSFVDVYSERIHIYESIVYGDFISNNGHKTSVVVDLKWSFYTDEDKRAFGELLIENPLGIYFVDYIEVEDTKS